MSIVWSWVFETKPGLANHLLESAVACAIPRLENGNTALIADGRRCGRRLVGRCCSTSAHLTAFQSHLHEASLIDGCSSLTRFLAPRYRLSRQPHSSWWWSTLSRQCRRSISSRS
ncbi:hypothetical protein O9992_21370 [Vibrio lentus]|nr:hypothetical protein [Vibrio lentus]